jgi:hypothetical protein
LLFEALFNTFGKKFKKNKMKKTTIFFSALLIISLTTTSVQAQMLRNVAKGAVNQAKSSTENRAAKEVNKEVDKGVNKFIDNLIGTDESEEQPTSNERKAPDDAAQNSQANVNRFMQKLGVETTEIPRKEEYKFNSQIVTITESTDFDGSKNAPVELVICYNDINSDLMFNTSDQSNSQVSIVDNENKCFLVLTNDGGNKTGFATKFDPEALSQTANAMSQSGIITEQAVEEEIECKMAKTGKTKKISGFNCEEYKCENENEIETAWITKDHSINNNNIFGQTPWGSEFAKTGFDGMIIQYETKSKKDQSSSVMTVKSIDTKKSSSFSTTDYQISSFSLSVK